MILRIPALLLGITVHEFAHGKVADLLGDPTAKLSGRLSFNPIKHLDILGAIMILIFGFGWAKPVPITSRNFRQPERDMMYVGLAGPLANFLTAFLLGRIIKVSGAYLPALLVSVAEVAVIINIALGIFNLIPIPPMDGSRILAAFMPANWRFSYQQLESYGLIILILLLTVFGPIFHRIFGSLVYSLVNLAL
jgi:Zn-dependent protease